MKKLLTLLTTGLMAGLLSAAVPIPEPATNIYGKLKGNEVVITNQLSINQAIIENLGGSSGGSKMIYGEGLDNNSVCYKITLAQSSDIAHVAPPVSNLYLSELSLYGEIYGADDMKLKPPADAGGYSVVETDGQLKIQATNSLGVLDTWQFENEAVTGLVLKVSIPEKTTYGYSHPYDWNIFWTALAARVTDNEGDIATNAAAIAANTAKFANYTETKDLGVLALLDAAGVQAKLDAWGYGKASDVTLLQSQMAGIAAVTKATKATITTYELYDMVAAIIDAAGATA